MPKPIADEELKELLNPLVKELKKADNKVKRADKVGYFIFNLMVRSGLKDTQVYGQLEKVKAMILKSTKKSTK